MRVTRVGFKKNFPISLVTHEHVHYWAEVEIESHEEATEGFELAEKTVFDRFKMKYPKIPFIVGTEEEHYVVMANEKPLPIIQEKDR